MFWGQLSCQICHYFYPKPPQKSIFKLILFHGKLLWREMYLQLYVWEFLDRKWTVLYTTWSLSVNSNLQWTLHHVIVTSSETHQQYTHKKAMCPQLFLSCKLWMKRKLMVSLVFSFHIKYIYWLWNHLNYKTQLGCYVSPKCVWHCSILVCQVISSNINIWCTMDSVVA